MFNVIAYMCLCAYVYVVRMYVLRCVIIVCVYKIINVCVCVVCLYYWGGLQGSKRMSHLMVEVQVGLWLLLLQFHQ